MEGSMGKLPASHLSDADVARLRRALLEKRETLLTAQRASSREQRGIGDAEIEDGDVAERMIEQDEALSLAAFDATLLSDVERALAKLDAGGYGVSEDSGTPIELERLEAVPWARRTEEEEARHRR
jgi:DnaK suppressor protein